MKILMLHSINHNMFGKRGFGIDSYLLALRAAVSAPQAANS